MQADPIHDPAEIARVSGAGVFLSRKLIRQVPLADVISAIQKHDSEARHAFETDPTASYFETVRWSTNGVEFHVASDQSELLVSAYLPDETSGFPARVVQ